MLHVALAGCLLIHQQATAQMTMQPLTGGNSIEAPDVLIASWGTSAQCQAHKQNITHDMTLFPVVISDQWLQQGFMYCLVRWLNQQNDEQELRARAYLQCGEDNLRDYQVFFKLKDDKLRIRWSEDFTTDNLQRCD